LAALAAGGHLARLAEADPSGALPNVRRSYVDTRFGQVHLRAVVPGKEEQQKRPLMALHLSPNSGQVFSSFLPLIGRDRIAVAPDYPGYGMSDAIPGKQTLSDYAAAMLDVRDALGLEGPVDLLGYHTGAGVALEMARQRPQACGRLALVAVPLLTETERAAGAALPPIEFDVEGDFAREEWRRSWRWRGPGQSLESVLATFSEKMRPGARERGARAILAYDVRTALREAEHPLMIVRVKDDLWEPSARARALRPDARYVELPEYGHGLFHVAPERMDTILRKFLDAP
jgi:pimeloyl-ACP methyl ester carboxylesterase